MLFATGVVDTYWAAYVPLPVTIRVTDDEVYVETVIPVETRVPSVLTKTPSKIIDPSSGKAVFSPRVS